jgi:hypothetical protein
LYELIVNCNIGVVVIFGLIKLYIFANCKLPIVYFKIKLLLKCGIPLIYVNKLLYGRLSERYGELKDIDVKLVGDGGVRDGLKLSTNTPISELGVEIIIEFANIYALSFN